MLCVGVWCVVVARAPQTHHTPTHNTIQHQHTHTPTHHNTSTQTPTHDTNTQNGKKKKTEFCCNGTVVDDPELGHVIQLQGDQRKNVHQFLTQEGLVKKDHIKIHGF